MVFAKQFEKNRSAPIKQRRLFEPRPPVQPRCYPITRFRHVASDPRIAWLIRTDESNHSEIAEITDVQRNSDEDYPGGALRHARHCLVDWLWSAGQFKVTRKLQDQSPSMRFEGFYLQALR